MIRSAKKQNGAVTRSESGFFFCMQRLPKIAATVTKAEAQLQLPEVPVEKQARDREHMA